MEAVAHPVSQPRIKRQYRTVEERRRIVEETLVPGVSVAMVARANGVNANQLFGWRKLYQSGLLGSNEPSLGQAARSAVRLLPVTVAADIAPAPAQAAVTPQRDVGDASPGSIELTLAKARLRIIGQVDAAVVRLVLELLRT